METRSYSRYILVVLCVAVVFTALTLVALSAWMRQSGPSATSGATSTSDQSLQEAYRQGYNAARAKFIAMGTITTDDQTRTMSGTVIKAGSKTIVVKQTNLDTDPLVDNVSDDRNVTLAANGKVYKETTKSEAQLNADLKAFQNASANNPALTPPTATTRQEIKLSDIPVGASVRVTSNDPVRLAKDITAVEIVYVVSAQ